MNWKCWLAKHNWYMQYPIRYCPHCHRYKIIKKYRRIDNMCESNLTSKDLEIILNMFKYVTLKYSGLGNREIHVETKVKKLYAWSKL